MPSPLHPLAISFAEFEGKTVARDVVVFTLHGDNCTITAFGRLVSAVHNPKDSMTGRRRRLNSLGFKEQYDGYQSSSSVGEFEARYMGLRPRIFAQSFVDSGEIEHLPGVRDLHDPRALWSNSFTVPREVAHRVLGCTLQEFDTIIAEFAVRRAEEIRQEQAEDDAWYDQLDANGEIDW